MFIKLNLDLDEKLDLFTELSKQIDFEDVLKGRRGTVILNQEGDNIPIVRTTTVYDKPAQTFTNTHFDIINSIKEALEKNKALIKKEAENIDANLAFYNALIEIYDNKYRKMGFHTDQALDLKNESYICLFSCYENDSNNQDDLRTLRVKNKRDGKQFDLTLENRTAILFSTSTNRKHLHQIILDGNKKAENRWLGVTFRVSKTFVKFIDSVPHIEITNEDNIKTFTELKQASIQERKAFYKFKGIENRKVNFEYPQIDWTISPSDRTKPV